MKNFLSLFRKGYCRHCGNILTIVWNGPNRCLHCYKSQLISPAMYEILESKEKTQELYSKVFDEGGNK